MNIDLFSRKNVDGESWEIKDGSLAGELIKKRLISEKVQGHE